MSRQPAFNLPNLIIIGSQKCGTTSLHYYLGAHPEIFMSRAKELNFFVLQRNWQRGIEWYRSNFHGQARIYGESSPNYTNYPVWADVPERMHSVIPEARLIYLVRDPLERIVAHYMHRVAGGSEDRSLDEALAPTELNPYLSRSRYFLQIEQFLKFYPLSRILIVNQLDLKHSRRETLRRIFRYLEVNDEFASPLTRLEAHRTRDKRSLTPLGRRIAQWPAFEVIAQAPFIGWRLQQILLSPFSQPLPVPALEGELRERVQQYLKPDTDRFRQLTGQAFSEWSV